MLRSLDLERLYRSKPMDAYAHLQATAANAANPDILFALAEMSYVLGHRADKVQAGGGCLVTTSVRGMRITICSQREPR